MQKLFGEFSAVSAQQWKDQLIKDLKGADADLLNWKTTNGFTIHPFYTAEDLKEKKQPLFTHNDWDICPEIVVDNEHSANQQALNELNSGATALLFYIHKGVDLDALLKGILIEHITVHFVFDFPAEDFAKSFDEIIKKRKLDQTQLKGSINIDPIENLIRTGNWKLDEQNDLNELRTLNSQLRTICVNANIYNNSGATAVFELACSLAHAHEYISYLTSTGTNTNDVASKFQFNIAVGSDFFMEIAKLRALRKLWNLLLEQYTTKAELFIHCETTLLDKTILDPYNNMLRSTTEAMSAIIGGCNSLSVRPFDITYKTTAEFSSRMARNQQLILKDESYLDKVADIGAGSYYIESLTDKLAEAAWEEFKTIEAKGGMLNCLKSGYIQAIMDVQANEQLQDIKDEKRILIGVNKYMNSSEKISSEFGVDDSTSSDTLIRPLKTIRLAEQAEQKISQS